MNPTFAESVLETSTRAEVHAAVRDLYQSLQTQIDLRRPICKTSGRCCRFDEFGHRLYVTTAEMGTFQHDITEARAAHSAAGNQRLPVLPLRYSLRPAYSLPQPQSPTCRYQIDGLCSVHLLRPFGCRIFFCDASSTDWQHQQYELYHRQLQAIHERFAIPYFYMEWRAALAAVGL